MSPIRVGVVGATGAVGLAMIACLERSRLEIAELRPMASGRSSGRELEFAGAALPLVEACPEAFSGLDLVFFAAGAAVSRELAAAAVAAGALVVDNSSAFRADPDVPLIVPELNASALDRRARLIANPNCSTILALMALGPLARAFGLRSVVASTYQAVSGAGAAGLLALAESSAGRKTAGGVFPVEIAGNVIPLVGGDLVAGFTDEERKMGQESRKILALPELEVFCTCVRVPVERAHTVSLWATFAEEPVLADARRLLESAPGLDFVADEDAAEGLNPRAAEGQDEVLVGRLRAAGPKSLALVVVGDQVLKGAALNAVQIAEDYFVPEGPGRD